MGEMATSQSDRLLTSVENLWTEESTFCTIQTHKTNGCFGGCGNAIPPFSAASQTSGPLSWRDCLRSADHRCHRVRAPVSNSISLGRNNHNNRLCYTFTPLHFSFVLYTGSLIHHLLPLQHGNSNGTLHKKIPIQKYDPSAEIRTEQTCQNFYKRTSTSYSSSIYTTVSLW